MNLPQRKVCNAAVDQILSISLFLPSRDVALTSATIGVDLLAKKEGVKLVLEADELVEIFKNSFAHQIFRKDQVVAIEYGDAKIKLELSIESFDHAVISGSSSSSATTAAGASASSAKLYGMVSSL
jgi:hypothetical protein